MAGTFKGAPVTTLNDIVMEHALSQEERQRFAIMRAVYDVATNAGVLRRALEMAVRSAGGADEEVKRRKPPKE